MLGVKRAFAILLFCQFAIFAQAQIPEWLVGTWEREVHDEDGDFVIRYNFSKDSTFSISNRALKTKSTMIGRGVVLSFEKSILRLRQDLYEINGEPFPDPGQGYVWEENIKLMDPKTLRIIDSYPNELTQETKKDISYFRKVK